MTKHREFTKREEEWIKDFGKVMRKAPRSLFMFVGSGDVVVYAGRVMNEHKSVDQYNTNRVIKTNMECDGGDW